MKKHRPFILSAAIALTLASAVDAQIQGPSTGSTPYAVPTHPDVITRSIFTVDNTGANPDDQVGGYGMVGIPDGLGAFDNGNGTFTVLMNHEIGSTAGVARAHGNAGSFVSKWTIDKNTLAVTGGSDLIQNFNLWNGASYPTYNAGSPAPSALAMGRLCSADLPAVGAFSFGSLGTTERIFMNGEEIGNEGRAFGHIATGVNAGTTYELPALGKFSWENSVASPLPQAKTIVMGLDDNGGSNLGVYMYVGTKTNSGTEVDKAGLTNGLLYSIKVDGGAPQVEDRTTELGIGAGSKPFSLVLGPNAGNVTNTTGLALENHSIGAGTTDFLRPEDGAWDTINPDVFYFATTDRYDQVKDGVGAQVGRTRLWKLDFFDMANPELGGDISLLLDGTEATQMIDNLTVDIDGNILLQEDVGGQAHNGKLWRYNPNTDSLTMLAKHDPARNGDIGVGTTGPFNNDEEFSGVIDITNIMAGSALNSGNPNERWYLLDDQQHYGIAGAQVEGGQLIAVQVVPEPTAAISVIGGLGMLLGLRRRRA